MTPPSSTTAPGGAQHAEALERFGAGAADDAIALLREAIEAALAPELVNDLAVMLSQQGDTEQARDLLVALRRLAPEYHAAVENLAALPGVPSRAGSDRMHEARAQLLQLVSDSQHVHLADNLDHLFAPMGHGLPDPAETGERLAAELDVLDRCGVLWSRFGDDNSRELFLRLLAYRALGPAHVRLELDALDYRRTVMSMNASMVEQASVAATGNPFEWQFHLYNLSRLGYPVRIVGQALPLASTYAFSQYAYRDATAGAAPQPGDVALDVGGCWGETALWLAHLVGPAGRVHSFEPSPQNRKLLRKNLELNPGLADRVDVSEAPLSARAGDSVWIPDRLSAGATVQDGAAEGMAEAVTDTIDARVARGELDRVDFIKVDVEGADLGVLEGAAETIRRDRPRLALACYHKPDDLAVLPDFVDSLGVPYRWYLQCSTLLDADLVALAVPDS